LSEGGDLQGENQPNRLVVEQCSDSDRVRSDQVGLKLGQMVVRDADLRQLAEAGVDPVCRVALLDDFLNGLSSPIDCSKTAGVKPDWLEISRKHAQFGKR
jgi:hypothetical protein